MSGSSNYEVGYAKPPKDTRFKPGQSGNPKGRPKGSKNLATIVREAAAEKVMVTERGRQRAMSKVELCISQLMNRAAKGELPATKVALGLLRDSEAMLETEEPVQVSEHTQAINELVAQRIRLMQNTSAGEEV